MNDEIVGSNPTSAAVATWGCSSMGEQFLCKEKVAGSTPVISTTEGLPSVRETVLKTDGRNSLASSNLAPSALFFGGH